MEESREGLASEKSWNEYRLMVINELQRVATTLHELAEEVRELKIQIEVSKKDREQVGQVMTALTAVRNLAETNVMACTALEKRIIVLETHEAENAKVRVEVGSLSKKIYAISLIIAALGPKVIDWFMKILGVQ